MEVKRTAVFRVLDPTDDMVHVIGVEDTPSDDLNKIASGLKQFYVHVAFLTWADVVESGPKILFTE